MGTLVAAVDTAVGEAAGTCTVVMCTVVRAAGISVVAIGTAVADAGACLVDTVDTGT